MLGTSTCHGKSCNKDDRDEWPPPHTIQHRDDGHVFSLPFFYLINNFFLTLKNNDDNVSVTTKVPSIGLLIIYLLFIGNLINGSLIGRCPPA